MAAPVFTVLDDARRWIADCLDLADDDCNDLTDAEVRSCIDREYVGSWSGGKGWAAFTADRGWFTSESEATWALAGPFCGCGDYSCPASSDSAAFCVNREE